MTELQALDLAKWLLRKIEQIDYGEVTITAIVHGNECKRVEQIVREKHQLDETRSVKGGTNGTRSTRSSPQR